MLKKYGGIVRGGKFLPDEPRMFREAFYSHEGKRVSVIVARERKHRTNPQNRYYWGVVVALLSDNTGYTPDEMNDLLKWRFNRWHRDNLPDTVKSFKDLSTVEFEEKMSQIRVWASVDLAVYIPEPNETFNECGWGKEQ